MAENQVDSARFWGAPQVTPQSAGFLDCNGIASSIAYFVLAATTVVANKA